MANLVNMDVIMKRKNGYYNTTKNWYKNHEPTTTFQFRPNQNQNHHQHKMERVNVINPPPSSSSPPQLWGSHNSSPSPPKSPSHPLLGRSSSSDSRARTRAIIARGQWELMEMVKNMPESSYELSLKDLVVDNQQQQQQISEINDDPIRAAAAAVVKSKRQKADFEQRGLFLNLVSPFSFINSTGQKKRKKKKKVKVGRNFSNSKVSPKVIIDGGDNDWWKKKKRFTGSSDSNSSGGTTVSSGGGSTTSGGGRNCRKKNGSPAGCWHLFRSSGRKSEE